MSISAYANFNSKKELSLFAARVLFDELSFCGIPVPRVCRFLTAEGYFVFDRGFSFSKTKMVVSLFGTAARCCAILAVFTGAFPGAAAPKSAVGSRRAREEVVTVLSFSESVCVSAKIYGAHHQPDGHVAGNLHETRLPVHH